MPVLEIIIDGIKYIFYKYKHLVLLIKELPFQAKYFLDILDFFTWCHFDHLFSTVMQMGSQSQESKHPLPKYRKHLCRYSDTI